MNPELSPLAGVCIILLGVVFLSLFVAWCCKQCSLSKHALAPLACPGDPFYGRPGVMTAVDVQTGLPVVIQAVGRGSRNLVRVTPIVVGGRYSINPPGCPPANYGSTGNDGLSPIREIEGVTPPPSYSEVCPPPRL